MIIVSVLYPNGPKAQPVIQIGELRV